jgi:hypothetical protein
MKKISGIFAGIVGLCLPFVMQFPASAQQSRVTNVAFGIPAASPQDQDDRDRRDDRDRNGNWDANRDRDWHRNHDRRNRDWDDDRDRGWHNNQGYRGGYGRGYQGVLAPEWQQKYDSYYQRWLNYRATNNQSQMRSMEGRMQSIMRNYNIPPNTPYGEVASNGGGRY